MQKKSYDALKYTNYSKYHVINVWAEKETRELIVKRKLLTDKNFKLSSLQVNPLYKPIFDKLEAVAEKELNALDKSVLWSRRYQPKDFRQTFAYPSILYTFILFCVLTYGVKYRVYYNYIKHGRVMGIAEKFDIDLDDVENYPKPVFEYYLEKKAYDAHIERKETKIKQVEDNFHKFTQKRVTDLAQRRKNRGLRVEGGRADEIKPQELPKRRKKSKAKASNNDQQQTKTDDAAKE